MRNSVGFRLFACPPELFRRLRRVVTLILSVCASSRANVVTRCSKLAAFAFTNFSKFVWPRLVLAVNLAIEGFVNTLDSAQVVVC